jgi:hypothetical protein
MQVQGRIVNTKRHTIGYKIGGRNRTRREAVQLARQGRIEGVTVRYGGRDSSFIASVPGGPNLYELPVRVAEDGQISRAAAR